MFLLSIISSHPLLGWFLNFIILHLNHSLSIFSFQCSLNNIRQVFILKLLYMVKYFRLLTIYSE